MKLAVIESSERSQQELGQFLTAAHVAEFMASLFGPLPSVVRLLDAGAGAGSLTAAFTSRLCKERCGVRAIEATLYEVDPVILDALSATLQVCRSQCAQAGIQFTFTVHSADFIREMAALLAGDLFAGRPPVFDAAIVNPPYRKISTDSPHRYSLSCAGIETSNLYTGFVALIQRLLVAGGQLVGITPRSFCNGPYFRSFREDFLNAVDLRRLHVFDSRQAAFREDNVLQENVIFHAVKGRAQSPQLLISSSSGQKDGKITKTVFPFGDIVYPHDPDRFIHIPSALGHSTAKETMDGLRADLASLGVTVSTGRVVDFRLKDALRQEPENGTVPLLYPCHFNGGTVQWPRVHSRKPNAILDNAETRPWLVPSGIYLLTKRFTSKEERRRVVTCLFDPAAMPNPWVGFENHLNYFHANGKGLDRDLAVGLHLFLSSTVVDQYFRRFSGHTQVNATDLRRLSYPDRDTLEAMGREASALDLAQDQIDQLVARHLHGGQ